MSARDVIENVLRNRDEPSPWTAANDILSALADAGYVVVPREPTERMLRHGVPPLERRASLADVYQAMITATHQQGEERDG